jgi:hypothetical protein
MDAAVVNDPGLAIGTAKELVETCCKTILTERGVQFSKAADIPELVKLTSKELELTPGDIPDKAKAAETIKRLLSNLATITQGIPELRNHHGTGHGKTAGARGLQALHAKLAVGAASTLAVFLAETHNERGKGESVAALRSVRYVGDESGCFCSIGWVGVSIDFLSQALQHTRYLEVQTLLDGVVSNADPARLLERPVPKQK